MSSPVEIPLQSFIKLDRSLKTPIFLQLSQQITHAIQRGYLAADTKLPGSRSIADLFGLHRKTVIAAYEDLSTQGWIEIKANKYAIVLPTNQKRESKVSLTKQSKETGYSFKNSTLLDTPFEESSSPLQFNDGQPDYRITQLSYLSSLYSAALKRKTAANNLSNSKNNIHFREQLGNYLNLSRGLNTRSENICLTKSNEMSLYFISRTLLTEDDNVVVASIGKFSANMTFQNAGANLITIPVDEKGLNIDELAKLLTVKTIRMVYVNPNLHYPTTASLSAPRRMQLLALAAQYKFIIVEDDEDDDFYYDKNKILPLASTDKDGMIVYLGTFGKSLAPAFSSGFIVAPHNLISELEKYAALLNRSKDTIMEQIMAEMIAEGEIHRHLRKTIKVYKERRSLMFKLLEEQLGSLIHVQKPKSGLAFWLTWKAPVNLKKLAKTCAEMGLHIPNYCLYQNKSLTAMRLGFTHFNEMEMQKAIEIIKTAYLKLSKQSSYIF